MPSLAVRSGLIRSSVHRPGNLRHQRQLDLADQLPTQALGLLNGSFSNEQAATFADRLEAEAGAGDLAAQARLAVLLTTGREPSADEQ